MKFTELNYQQDEKIYKAQLPLDFPSGEIKLWSVVSGLINRGIYNGYGLFEDEKLLAYAFVSGSGEYCLLDYFAVVSAQRGKGTGSMYLQELAKLYKRNIIIEVERVECAKDEVDKEKRERRISFYERNGVLMTAILATAFGQPYNVMCLPINDSFNEKQLRYDYEAVYRTFTDNFERDIVIC